MRSVSSQDGLVRLCCLSALAALLAVSGCRRSQPTGEGGGDSTSGGSSEEAAAEEPGPPPPDWPRVLVVGPGTGPALFLGHEEDAPAFGYLGVGARVRLESAPMGGRVRVLVGGRLATRGWVPLSRLGAYAQRRGRIQGTRAYVGPGDFVRILGPADEAGQTRVEVRPWLGDGRFIGPFVGTFPTEDLGDRPPEGEVEGVSEGECFRAAAGQTVTIHATPRGEPVANLPVLDPPITVTVLRHRGDLFGVRAGFGPYVTGYVRGGLEPCEGEPPPPEPLVAEGEGELPYWMSQEEGRLLRVASGTRIRFHHRTIGRLRREGWAREIGRQDHGLVDVFIAVDDSVAVRGLVRERALTPVEGQEEEPEELEDLPDELR